MIQPGRARTPRRSTPSRSWTAGSCWRRPPCTAPPGVDPFYGPGAKNPTDRPGPADVQAAADEPRPDRPARPDLRVRAPRHPGRTDRPPDPRRDRVPLRLRPRPDRLRARVRAQSPTASTASTPPARPARASTSRRSTASRSSATRAPARSPTSRSAGCSPSRAHSSPTRSSR